MPSLHSFIRDVRFFNRFYVDVIGLLRTGSYYGQYSLTETRILFEIHQANRIQASQIMALIEIDKSYLSRILRRLQKENLISRTPSQQDARALSIELTEKGHAEFAQIDQDATNQVDAWTKSLDEKARLELVAHMDAIMKLFNRQLIE